MDIKPYLKLMVAKQASDMFLSTGAPVNIKIDGASAPINSTPFSPGQVREIAYALLNKMFCNSPVLFCSKAENAIFL